MPYGTLNGTQKTDEKAPEQKQKSHLLIKLFVGFIAFCTVADLVNLFIVSGLSRKVVAENKVRYTPYTNQHGGYSVCFNSAVFSRDAAPENSNIQTFVSRDGLARFSICTSKLGNWSLAQLMDQDAEAYTQFTPDTIITGKGLGSYTYNVEATRVGEKVATLAIMDNQLTVNRLRTEFDTNAPSDYAVQFHQIGSCFESTGKRK